MPNFEIFIKNTQKSLIQIDTKITLCDSERKIKMSNTQVITRKIKLFPIGDKEEINRVYTYIRNGQYAQYQASNLLMGELMSIYYKYNRDIKNENFKEEQKEIYKAKNPIFEEIEFAIGNDTLSAVTQKVKQDFSTALKNGLAKGERTITNYKRTNPLITRSRVLKFKHNYESHQDFLDNLYSNKLNITLDWVNKISFNVILGSPHKSAELRSVFQNIFEENYKVCGSSIQIDGKDIILNLSLQISINELELDENTVVGVDLGLAIPAMCGLNTNDYIKKSIGSAYDFVRVRTKIQAQKRRLQKQLKYTNGGHGRNKKMKPMDRFNEYEKNFVKTYNHMVSKNIVDFAIKNKAKYINMEDLSGFNSSEFILRNWSYYQLQQDVIYKAKMNNIEVRFINPYHTSQICSKCGHWEEGQRDSQSHFKCKCCGYEANADFNASRNIALSTDFK